MSEQAQRPSPAPSSSGAARPGHLRAVCWLLVATAGWGLSFPLGKVAMAGIREAVPEASSWFATALPMLIRFPLAALLLLALFPWAARAIGRKEVLNGVVLGLITGSGMLLQMNGTQSIPASTAAFLTQFCVVFVPFLAAFEHRRWPTARVWPAIGLVIFGAAILSDLSLQDLQPGWGETQTLIATVFFALHIWWLDRGGYVGTRPLPCTVVMFSTITVLYAVIASCTAPSLDAFWKPLASSTVWAPMIGLTFFSSAVAFALMNRWQPHVSATEAGIIYCMESVFASAFALFLPGLLSLALDCHYPNETLTTQLLLGGGLIFGANLLVQLPSRQKK